MDWIDLTHCTSPDTPPYPGDRPLQFTASHTLARDGFLQYTVAGGLHVGTHLDMPAHMTTDPRLALDFPVDCFAAAGVLLDVRGQETISAKPAYTAMIPEKSAVLLYTGFDRHFGSPVYFQNHPQLDESMTALLKEKQTMLLGMDMPSPDRGDFAQHVALLHHGIFLLENLTNLHALLNIPQFEVLAMPLKISAEASPVRAVCRVLSP